MKSFITSARGGTAMALILLLAGLPARSQGSLEYVEETEQVPGLSLYGVPGHIEMPSAYSLPDGTFAFSANIHAGGVWRGNMVFQITPRLAGTFRYSYMKEFFGAGDDSLYDRSFDVKYRLFDEDPQGWQPAVAVGLQDFGGTGVFGAEYLVASKRFGSLTTSAGLGWGRFGSYGGFRNPLSFLAEGFRYRDGIGGLDDTGKIDFGKFFRGDSAIFLGADWQVNDRLSLSLEYSSDAMKTEVDLLGFEHRSPVNLGLEYRLRNGGTLGVSLLYGSAAAVSYSVILDPGRPAAPSGREPGPPPVMRGAGDAAASWGLSDQASASLSARPADLAAALSEQGITLEGISIEDDTAVVAIRNDRWPATAQSLGRTARVLSATLPAELRKFHIQVAVKGMNVTEITLDRDDLEDLEFAPDGAWQIWARAGLADPAGTRGPWMEPEQKFTYSLRPYLEPAFFDPDSPLRLDFGGQLTGEWTPARGLYFSGAIRQKLIGNLDASTRLSDSVLPHVRSSAALYAKHDGPSVPWLTAEYFMRPGQDLYARGTAGLLEPMFGGLSGELLWAPAGRRYALGAELNYAVQRDYDGLGFLDYDVMTGHVSGYYDFGGGYHGQLDIGRYLAGDIGATVTLTRRFGNGFEVGAFATLTDVSFEDFGEGAFDKGITFRVPLTWVTGQPSTLRPGMTIRPIQRDGGARLSVRNRLIGLIEAERAATNGESWGRFWR